MEKFVFMAGVKESVEIAKIDNKDFFNKKSQIVEELPIYMDGKSLTWRYRLNYPDSREEGSYLEGITVDFKNMGETTLKKEEFTNTLNIMVCEPWFQGRLQEIRADAVWLEMDKEHEPSKLRNRVTDRFNEDLHDISGRLVILRREFANERKPVADLSLDSIVKVKDNSIKI